MASMRPFGFPGGADPFRELRRLQNEMSQLMFVLPRVARCRLAKAMAQLEMDAPKQGRKGTTRAGVEQEGRAEFRAEYTLDCANPVALDWIIFRFFERFANARVVEVTLVTGHGRATFRVGRAMPRIVFERFT
jgi:hypothetical protein